MYDVKSCIQSFSLFCFIIAFEKLVALDTGSCDNRRVGRIASGKQANNELFCYPELHHTSISTLPSSKRYGLLTEVRAIFTHGFARLVPKAPEPSRLT